MADEPELKNSKPESPADAGLSNRTTCDNASGAIFGVIGGLIGVVLLKKRWAKNKADFIDISLRSILTMAFFSVFAGFSGGGVDNAAHVGGLLSGFVIALLLAIKP